MGFTSSLLLPLTVPPWVTAVLFTSYSEPLSFPFNWASGHLISLWPHPAQSQSMHLLPLRAQQLLLWGLCQVTYHQHRFPIQGSLCQGSHQQRAHSSHALFLHSNNNQIIKVKCVMTNSNGMLQMEAEIPLISPWGDGITCDCHSLNSPSYFPFCKIPTKKKKNPKSV